MQSCPLWHLFDQCVVDVLSDCFGGGIAFVERWDFVQIPIVKWLDDRIHLLLNGVKIAEQPLLIKFGATCRNQDPPIVTVKRFSLPLDHDGVGGRECSFDTQLKRHATMLAFPS